MSYAFLEHTGDVGLELAAASREKLFVEALRGLTDTLTDVAHVRPELRRDVVLESGALDLLLVDWLNELLALFEVERLLFCEARVRLAGDGRWRLAARAAGERHDPRRHPHKVAVKAATYHRLAVERRGGGWRARVILDL